MLTYVAICIGLMLMISLIALVGCVGIFAFVGAYQRPESKVTLPRKTAVES